MIHKEDTFYECKVDHSRNVKHGGATEAANLANASVFCNHQKGRDVGSIVRTLGFNDGDR
jgi:hypothetical protein